MFKVSMEHENIKIEIQSDEAETIHDVMELINTCLLGVTFHPETIREGYEQMLESSKKRNVEDSE